MAKTVNEIISLTFLYFKHFFSFIANIQNLTTKNQIFKITLFK